MVHHSASVLAAAVLTATLIATGSTARQDSIGEPAAATTAAPTRHDLSPEQLGRWRERAADALREDLGAEADSAAELLEAIVLHIAQPTQVGYLKLARPESRTIDPKLVEEVRTALTQPPFNVDAAEAEKMDWAQLSGKMMELMAARGANAGPFISAVSGPPSMIEVTAPPADGELTMNKLAPHFLWPSQRSGEAYSRGTESGIDAAAEMNALGDLRADVRILDVQFTALRTVNGVETELPVGLRAYWHPTRRMWFPVFLEFGAEYPGMAII
ncbi:MAG: hypothetical protein SF028_12745 [Candidatus Sumerlaeia bacterium]|nr:hypothetical protein [Candidatus Sumerlaeia bacterium]